MNILTFDLEDWFHILDHPATSNSHQWEKFESRIHRNVDRLLELLNIHQQKATWFCLGWIIKKYPELVKKISLYHEIACHSNLHRLVYQQTYNEFKEDTLNAKKRIEDITGQKIVSYRASGFSITSKVIWSFEVLADCGFEVDCSVFPVKRNHGGFPELGESKPFIIKTGNQSIKEFPLNTFSVAGKKIIFSGGGYFRLLPYSIIYRMMKKSKYVMTYFHPRDFDPDQPIIKDLSLKRKFMSYYGLRTSFTKLDNLLTDFSFVNVQTALTQIEWSYAKIITL